MQRAWDLVAATVELPATERGLIKVIVEYKKALHVLIAHVQAIQNNPATSPRTKPRRKGSPA